MGNLSILTDLEVKLIHESTLKILSETGIVLTHAKGQEILSGAGATIKGDRVYLPPELVEAQVAKCPKQIVRKGRNGESIILGGEKQLWHNVGGACEAYNAKTGEQRAATIQDLIDSTRLLDALENVAEITPYYTPRDVPPEICALAMYRHSIPHTVKPNAGPAVQTLEEVNFMLKMAEVIGKPSELLGAAISPISPLIFPDDIVDAAFALAQNDIPVAPLPCPTAGMTAPLSLAGAITQQNAEILATIVLVQLIKEGVPVQYCGRISMMDPKTGNVLNGVETGLASAGTVQIGHFYGLPVNVYGLTSNSYALDIQSGFERSFNALIPAMAGADELSGIGDMGGGIHGSLAMMVCDDEIISNISHIRKGYRANDHSLAVDVVDMVMDGSRNFIDQMHTIQFIRSKELRINKLAKRQTFEQWDKAGRLGMAENAMEKAENILNTHEVPPLEDAQEKELDAILAAAQKALVKD